MPLYPIETTDGLLVLCPACNEEVILSLQTWHTDCGNPEINERIREETEARRLEWEEQAYPEQEFAWGLSKKGNYWTKAYGLVLIVSQNKRGWSNGAFWDGDDSGKMALQWKNNKSSGGATNELEKRVKRLRSTYRAQNNSIMLAKMGG